MATIQELSTQEIDEVLREAAERKVPMLVTIRSAGTWANLHSRVLVARDAHLLIEMPQFEPGLAPHEFVPAERIGGSFKLGHHKHIFAATVVGQGRFSLEDGTEVPALDVVAPSRVERLQRRVYMRVDVPANWIVRASFWQGACDSEPSGGSPLHPVWFGRVVNISAGGMLLAAEEAVSRALEPGDTVGMRLSFVSSGESLYTDAQFRHLEADKGRVLLGFQFLGLTETPEGRVVLQMISAKVSEYQRIALQNATFKEN